MSHRPRSASKSRSPRAKPRQEPACERSGERLQKVMAAAGVASRRESEQLILEGRVEVDGEVVSQLGSRVEAGEQEIRVDGEPIAVRKRLYFAVHKPSGIVSTSSDPSGRRRVIDLLPPDLGRVFNVGRLDLASEGLILVTNDGELANELTHPRYGVEKTYHVQVAGHPDAEVIKQMRRGVRLAEAFVKPVRVRIKSHRKQSTVLEMVLDEGRNREIRRLLARLGHKVQKLVRIAVGPVRLGDLPAGAYRPLTKAEVAGLREVTRTNPARSTNPRRKRGAAARGKRRR